MARQKHRMRKSPNNTNPFPRKVKILGHTFKVYRPHKLFLEENAEHSPTDRAEAFGVMEPHDMRISVVQDASLSLQYETFYHEIIEAVNFLMELNLEHAKIQQLGLALYQIFGASAIESLKRKP